jgi:hypothetical protein
MDQDHISVVTDFIECLRFLEESVSTTLYSMLTHNTVETLLIVDSIIIIGLWIVNSFSKNTIHTNIK